MKPRVIWPDPIAETLRVLRANAVSGGLLEGMTFGTIKPDPTVDGSPVRPAGVVSVDYSFTKYPTQFTANMRLVIWAATADQASNLAQRCQAVVLSYPGDSKIRDFRGLSGVLPAGDPGTPICPITFSLRLKPSSI